MRHVTSQTVHLAVGAVSLLLLSLLVTEPARAQQFGDQRVITTNADSAQAVFAADLDGDGDRDVLSASRADDKIAWYENFSGEFGGQQVISTNLNWGDAVFAADLDGDGDKDVLASAVSGGKLVWFENAGDATFGEERLIDDSGPLSIYATDLDGDGDKDVLTPTAWYENMGGGSFSDPRFFATTLERPKESFAKDLDGDGDKDILTVALDGDNVVWYENFGGGDFSSKNVITSNASGARTVYATDIDGDGDPDVLVGSSFTDKVAWYENAGGSFSTEHIITTAVSPSAVHAADANGDGEVDVFASTFGGRIGWWENTGSGSFSEESIVTTNVEFPLDVYASDLDGDAVPDLLSASQTDSKVAWYQNLGSDETAPAAPTGLQASAGDQQVDLNWDANTEDDLDGYVVYRSNSSFQELANATRLNDLPFETASYTDTAVSNGTEYFYRVTAVDTSGNESSGSNEASAVPNQETAPAAPSGLQATGGNDYVSLGWDNNTESDLAGYNVYRSTSSFQEVANATQINTSLVGSVYVDTSVTNGTEYFYRVTAVDSSGNESAASNEDSAIPRPPPTAETEQPSNVTGTSAVFHGQVDPNGAETDAIFFYYPAGQSGDTLGVLARESPVTGTEPQSVSAQVGELTPNTEYIVTVTASNGYGGAVGEELTFTTGASALAAPTGLQATAGDGEVNLVWDASSDAALDGYNVYRSTSSFQEVTNATQVNDVLLQNASYTDPGVSNGTEYYYRVTAVDTSGTESAGSNEDSAVPGDQTAPASPAGLSATAGDGQVSLGWDPNSESDLLGYNIYRFTSSFQEVSSATRVTSEPVSSESYTDTGVSNGTEYFYRVTAVDTSGNESAGSNEASATPTGAPVAHTEAATDVSGTGAVLNGRVNPGGSETTVVFDYYPTGQSSDAQTVTAQQSPLTGTNEQDVSAQIGDLQPGTEYTFEVIAENSSGSDAGGTQTFTTGAQAPTAETGEVTNITVDGARFTGTVNPHGSETTVVFEYSLAQSDQVRAVEADESPLTGAQSQSVGASVADLEPGREYTVEVVATNSAGVQRGASRTFTTSSLDVALERSSQVPERGQPFDVIASLPDGFQPTEVAQLFYRRVGTLDFQSVSFESTDATTYEATVPGSAVTARGIEYYAHLSDGEVGVTLPEEGGAQPRYAPVSVPEMEAAVGLEANQYRMISVPLQLERSDALEQLTDDFGPVDRSVWRLLRWNADAGEYDEVTTQGGEGALVPGRAYWLITSAGEAQDGDATFDVQGARSVPASRISLQLPPGWSQVANPRSYPVAWSSVFGRQSVMAPVAYDPAAPDSADYDVSVLDPWTGYWVYNPGTSAVQLQVPAIEAGAGQGPAVASKSQAGRKESIFDTKPAYSVAITAEMEREGEPALRDAHTVMGVAEDGHAGVGVEDVAEPPPIGDYLRVSIVEDETPLAGSLRPAGEDGYEWDLKVSAAADGDRVRGLVQGTLEARGTLPPGFERRLIDVNTGRRIPISGGTFSVQLTDERPTRHLRLIVGTTGFAEEQSDAVRPDETGLRAVYPNPSRGQVSVDFRLKTPQRVRIGVYDLLGRKVKTLVRERRPAGHHTVRWNANSGSTPVASGAYIVRMKTESASASRRITILR